jgi:cytochrome bd-type quinol oxidase subunit 2
MRKFLEALSLAALTALLWQTYAALHGANRLPDRIPTHFDLAGNPNAWGPSGMLLTLPAVAMFLYLSISLVSRYPNSFNYPVRVTAQNRLRLQAIALNMVAFLKAETLCLFALLQYYTLQAARSERLGLPPWLMFAAIALVFLTMGYHVYAMRRAR